MNPDLPVRVGVAILAKAPLPGQAKTRMIPALGADGAARLQHWLLQRTVALALAADIGPVTLWCAGDPQHPAFALCRVDNSVVVRRQPEGDLGVRMLTALRESSTQDGTLVIGTDCPALTTKHLREAAHSLQRNEVVVYPAEDGGYVLIGMREPLSTVFSGIDWGTERVMAQTRQRLLDVRCTWDESITLWDVDRPADLARLIKAFPDVSGSLGSLAALHARMPAC